MAEIPSDIASSAAQASFQSREVGKEREAHRAGQAHAAGRQVRAADEAGATVDTADADARVFTDAEGSGSQGRSFEEEAPDEQNQPASPADAGIRADADGRLHVDLEA